MAPSKKRKISGLTGLELEMSLTQLKKLRQALIFEEVPESELAPDDKLGDQLDELIAQLESRTTDPLSLSFSAVDQSALDRLNITQAGTLLLQEEEEKLRDAIESTRQLGAGGLWSNETMYAHLSFLSNTYSDTNEASSRMFIDTFFFRTAAMVPSNQRVVVMLEKAVPAVRPRGSKMDTVSGVIDYTVALIDDPRAARAYLRRPPPLTSHDARKTAAFFTAEAKASGASGLDGHIPQAIIELVACAKHLQKAHIRGALTNGNRWIFLAANLDSKGEGASYWASEVIEWRPEVGLNTTVPGNSNRYDPAVIAGILSSWVRDSFSKFNGDQWFDMPTSTVAENQGPPGAKDSTSTEPHD